jgi:hypothetical protein
MSKRELWLAVFLSAIMLLPLCAVTYPPLTDYPYHLLRAHIMLQYGSPDNGYAREFSRSLLPSPYILADYIVMLLSTVLSLEAAGKVVLALCLLLLPWSMFCFLNAVNPRNTVYGFLGFPLGFNWYFHAGFVSYVLSIPFVLFTLGFWWKHRLSSRKWPLAVTACLVFLVYMSHLYSYLLTILLFAVIAARYWRNRAIVIRAIVPLIPAAAMLGYVAWRDLSGASPKGGSLVLVYSGMLRKAIFGLTWMMSYSRMEGVVFALMAVAIAALLIRASQRPRVDASIAAIVVIFGIAYLAAPDHVGRFYYFANRIAPFVLLFGAALLPAPLPRRAPWVIAAIAAAFVVQAGILAFTYIRINSDLADYARCVRALPRQAEVSFVIDRESARFGRLEPVSLFEGYRYMETGETEIPHFEGFVGVFRPLRYRNPQKSAADLRTDEELVRTFFSERYYIDTGGFAVVVGRPNQYADEAARQYGLDQVARSKVMTVYRKRRPVFAESEPALTIHSASQHPAYRLKFGRRFPEWPGDAGSTVVCSQGLVKVFSLHPAP